MSSDYGCTAIDYLHRGYRLLDGVQPASREKLLYAAWEFRCGIERALFEYLVLIHYDDPSSVMKKIEKSYHPDDFKRLINEGDPELDQKQRFTKLLLSVMEPDHNGEPNLDQLCKLYGRLNNYLHAAKRPEKTVDNEQWWTQLITLLGEVKQVLRDTLQPGVGYLRFNEEGLRQYTDWKEGRLTDDEVLDSFRRQLNQP